MKQKIFVLMILALFFIISFLPIGSCLIISNEYNIKEISTDITYYDVSFSSGGRFKYIFNFFPTFILNVKLEGDHSFMILKKMFISNYDGIEIEGEDTKITCSYPKEINNPYFDGYTYINEDAYFGKHTITVIGFDGKITIREETASTEVPFKNDMFIINGRAEQVIVS